MYYNNLLQEETIYFGYCIVNFCNTETGYHTVRVYGFDDFAIHDAEEDKVIRGWGFVLRLGEFDTIEEAKHFIRNVLVVS